jgi:hypothetical protein
LFLGIIHKAIFFENKESFCQFLASICLIGCACNLISQFVLAINRYINICWDKHFKKIFTRRRAYILCVACWIASFFVDAPNIFGWGNHIYDRKTASCVWNRLASLSFTLFFSVGIITTPCIIICSCYIRIFVFVMNSKNKVTLNNSSTLAKMEKRKKSIKIAKSLFFSFILFVICW